MNMKFFQRLAEKIRRSFGKDKLRTTAPDERQRQPLPEVEKPSATVVTNSSIAADNCVKQACNFLYKGDKPIGKSFGRRSEIRVVYVNSFVEAFLFFLRLCDQRLLSCRQKCGHLDCSAVFPDGRGSLFFTDKVRCRNKAVIALLKIEIKELQPQLSEIRFEIKH